MKEIKEESAIRIRKLLQRKEITELRAKRKATFIHALQLDSFTSLSYQDPQYELEFLADPLKPVRRAHGQIVQLETINKLIRERGGQFNEAQTSLILQSCLENMLNTYGKDQIRTIYQKTPFQIFILAGLDSPFEGVRVRRIEAQMKSLAFLGLLSSQEGSEANFRDFVWNYQLIGKFFRLLEFSSNLREVSESLWMMGSLIEIFPQKVIQVFENKSILQKLKAIRDKVPPIPDSQNALVFFLSKLLFNFQKLKVDVQPAIQRDIFQFHYGLNGRLEQDDKSAIENWVIGVFHYSEHLGVDTYLLKHRIYEFAIKRIMKSNDRNIMRFCIAILRNLFWEMKREVFELAFGEQKKAVLFLRALSYVFLEATFTQQDFKVFLQLIELFLYTLSQERKRQLLESGEPLPKGYSEVFLDRDLALMMNEFLIMRLVKMNLQHPQQSIKLKTGELVLYILDRQPPNSILEYRLIPRNLNKLPQKYLFQDSWEMYPISLKVLLQIVKKKKKEPKKVGEIVTSVKAKVKKLMGSNDQEVAKLAERFMEFVQE